VLVVLGEAERVASMFDVFRLLTDEVRELSAGWREMGWVAKKGAALPDDKLAERVKDTLRVPFAVLCGSSEDPAARRHVLFLPASGLTYAAFDGIDLVWRLPDGTFQPAPPDPTLLPFWNARAARPERENPPQRPGFPSEMVDRILEQKEPESAAQLQLLRIWFAADPPRPALEQALRRAGSAMAAPPPPAPVSFAPRAPALRRPATDSSNSGQETPNSRSASCAASKCLPSCSRSARSNS